MEQVEKLLSAVDLLIQGHLYFTQNAGKLTELYRFKVYLKVFFLVTYFGQIGVNQLELNAA